MGKPPKYDPVSNGVGSFASPHAVKGPVSDAWPSDEHNPPPETAQERRDRLAAYNRIIDKEHRDTKALIDARRANTEAALRRGPNKKADQ